MECGLSLEITYWAEPRADTIRDLEGIGDFRRELNESYITVVRARPGELGGGLYQLAIHVLASITLADLAKYLISNIAYDFIKSGSKSFILRPLLEAYEKLQQRNNRAEVDVEVLRISFQDSELLIHRLYPNSVVQELKSILRSVAAEYEQLVRPTTGERPSQIHIPVLEDEANDRLIRFRELLDVDETIKPQGSDYLRFWGLTFEYSHTCRVYDVHRHLLLDQPFFTVEEYWREWERRHPSTAG